ncbi:uncharacterized protein Z519_00513 [Cladophialophora bantiana CBS 173.52]|uniref:NAD-dependent epimerase/dehydratase domain-containing protein n=1 Tax=Cladophialophora bantiana (strain ATCC 10958 / CBS 173.52 / CDC B-1940 / NIH 8579) TaxID=1442370 RepID=A0A0D2I6E6_CLAB1|nr:uncharacterized protein Z519_00513 [Cladophialophora bantiana CBS 173.52]KIW98850.1 hypothetical protein Z519_00513 [Cladophialophora bantiana CBS 173.52]
MHGRSNSDWTALWGPIAQAVADGKSHLQVPVAPTSQSPVIHVDDVASAVRCGLGKISLLGGTSVYPVFDLVSTTENIRDILSAFARALSSMKGQGGKLELELVGPGDHLFLQPLGATVQCDSARARELLGWEPKRNGLVKEMGIYAKAWEASQGKVCEDHGGPVGRTNEERLG